MSDHFRKTPWGSWTILAVGDGWQVKRLVIDPHSRLSRQSHHHRSERWVVAEGIGIAEVDDERIPLGRGVSIEVLRKRRHRISNDSRFPLIVIEVQFGEHLSEKDIIRWEDDYGRV